MTDFVAVDIPLTAGPEIVAIPGPSIIPERVLGAMHRAMPDIYAGDLTDLIDRLRDLTSTLESAARLRAATADRTG